MKEIRGKKWKTWGVGMKRYGKKLKRKDGRHGEEIKRYGKKILEKKDERPGGLNQKVRRKTKEDKGKKDKKGDGK